MKKQLVLLLCMLSGYVTYAQQNVNALEFVKQAPWNLTKPEIDLKYKDYEVELADSIKTSISDSYAAIGDKIFGGFQFGKYDAYTCYVTHENTNKPHMFIIFVDPAQIIDADKRVLTYYTDSLLYANLGEPSYKQEDTINEKGDSVAVRFWEQQNTMLISTVAQYNSQPDKPLFFFITMINPDDGSSDFRVARWGDSMAEIIEREGRINEWEGQMINPNVYSFGSSIANKLCKVLYFFTSNDKLIRSKYFFTHVSVDSCISDYKELVSLLSEKYGEPDSQSVKWSDPSYERTRTEEGYEVYMGHLKYYTYWTTLRSEIIIALSESDGVINLAIEYSSTVHEQESKEERLRGL